MAVGNLVSAFAFAEQRTVKEKLRPFIKQFSTAPETDFFLISDMIHDQNRLLTLCFRDTKSVKTRKTTTASLYATLSDFLLKFIIYSHVSFSTRNLFAWFE